MNLPEEDCLEALSLSMGRKLTPAFNLLLFERSLPKEELFPPLAKGLLRADHTLGYPMTISICLLTVVGPPLLLAQPVKNHTNLL